MQMLPLSGLVDVIEPAWVFNAYTDTGARAHTHTVGDMQARTRVRALL